MFRNSIIAIFFLVSTINNTYSQNNKTGNTWNEKKDSIDSKIDSIIRSHYQNHNNHAVGTDYDESIPEGKYGFYVFDTLSKEIHEATLNTFEGKIKKVTNYYFFQGKLIGVAQVNVPVNDQGSNRLNKLDRDVYYWNDTLKRIIQAGKYKFDYKEDIEKAREIISRFNARYFFREACYS